MESHIMTTIIWGVFAVLALLWTGGAALLAQFIKWSVPGMALVGEASSGAVAAAATMPAWLSPFIEPALWTAVQQAVAGIVASLPAMTPLLGEVAAWLVPAVWVGWGLGLLSLLTLTLASTWLLRRSKLPIQHVKAGHLMALWRAFRR
jgi:sorbitol-specific phosphotransferase system component IIBC